MIMHMSVLTNKSQLYGDWRVVSTSEDEGPSSPVTHARRHAQKVIGGRPCRRAVIIYLKVCVACFGILTADNREAVSWQNPSGRGFCLGHFIQWLSGLHT